MHLNVIVVVYTYMPPQEIIRLKDDANLASLKHHEEMNTSKIDSKGELVGRSYPSIHPLRR